MKINLSTYVDGQQLPGIYFFILNKGLNAGKPAETPWANSFIGQFETIEERDYYYWLCFGIWITGKFRYHLIGTAIPFIRKDDLIMLLDLADAAIWDRKEIYMQSIGLLYEAQQQTTKLTARLADLQQAKVDILRHFIRI